MTFIDSKMGIQDFMQQRPDGPRVTSTQCPFDLSAFEALTSHFRVPQASSSSRYHLN